MENIFLSRNKKETWRSRSLISTTPPEIYNISCNIACNIQYNHIMYLKIIKKHLASTNILKHSIFVYNFITKFVQHFFYIFYVPTILPLAHRFGNLLITGQ